MVVLFRSPLLPLLFFPSCHLNAVISDIFKSRNGFCSNWFCSSAQDAHYCVYFFHFTDCIIANPAEVKSVQGLEDVRWCLRLPLPVSAVRQSQRGSAAGWAFAVPRTGVTALGSAARPHHFQFASRGGRCQSATPHHKNADLHVYMYRQEGGTKPLLQARCYGEKI